MVHANDRTQNIFDVRQKNFNFKNYKFNHYSPCKWSIDIHLDECVRWLVTSAHIHQGD